jgi:hypothetical protein
MPSTAAVTSPSIAGWTILPGLQVSPYGGAINSLKIYSFGLTSTNVITGSSTAIDYTISGLTTNDIPISLTPSTGVVRVGVGNAFVGASNLLTVNWVQNGTSTVGIPGLTAPGAAYTLLTMSYLTQSSSTTT